MPAKKSLTRSVRFNTPEQIEAVEIKARRLGMSVSTYLRVCALAGAGISRDLVTQTGALVTDIENTIGGAIDEVG
jgi:hypothetical protein